MSGIQEAEQVLAALNRAEKAQLLQWVVRDLGDAFPGIESSPDVCGGEPQIVRTRIPVWLLVQARRLGTSEAELLRAYPGVAGGRSGECLGLLPLSSGRNRTADPAE